MDFLTEFEHGRRLARVENEVVELRAKLEAAQKRIQDLESSLSVARAGSDIPRFGPGGT